MGGRVEQGGFLDQQSPFFQEEFPKLVSGGGDEKSPPPSKEEEKEPQYGPGPSLRPQSEYNFSIIIYVYFTIDSIASKILQALSIETKVKVYGSALSN